MLSLALAAPRILRLLGRSAPGEEETAASPSPVGEDASQTVERSIDVKLFFQAPDTPGLVMEDRAVAYSEDLSQQLRSVVEEIVKGSKNGLVPTLPPETKVLEVFFDDKGTAYVDLSGEASTLHAGGSAAELMSVYSVVNSLAANFPAVKRVQILVNDKPAATLAGHVSLGRPLHPDMTLLAAVGQPPGGPLRSPAPDASLAPQAAATPAPGPS